jgi:hypothetical protein
LTEAQTELAKNLLAQVKNIGTSMGSKTGTGVQYIPEYFQTNSGCGGRDDRRQLIVLTQMIVGFLALVALYASFVPRSFLSLKQPALFLFATMHASVLWKLREEVQKIHGEI